MEKTVVQRIFATAQNYPDLTALMYKDKNSNFLPITYKELASLVRAAALGFKDAGMTRGTKAGMISENRKEWIISDLALQCLGVCDVPRGIDSTTDEIAYILDHSESTVVFAEDARQLEKILSVRTKCPKLTTIILFESSALESVTIPADLKLLSFEDILKNGQEKLPTKNAVIDEEIAKGKTDDMITLIYTSGTTGVPKGVMLSSTNINFQLDRIYSHILIKPGDKFLGVLPIWHSFERAVNYIVLNRGGCIAYSKPIGKIMLDDMLKIRPQYLSSVPRIWESVYSSVQRTFNATKGFKKALINFFLSVAFTHNFFYSLTFSLLPTKVPRNAVVDFLMGFVPCILLLPLRALGNLLIFRKIKAKLGGKFIAGISGGGALPEYIDLFFQAAGIKLLEGYGLTETAPILSVRKQNHAVHGTVGPLLKDIEYKVLNKAGKEVGPLHKGVLHVRSPQIMAGYYKQPEMTSQVLTDGWLNTGDLVIFTQRKEIRIIGRAKETIVLIGGENIEPTPIEDKLRQSEYIDNVMVVGQDKKFLGALITPSWDSIEKIAAEKGISYLEKEELTKHSVIVNVMQKEIQELVGQKNGFKPFEQIYRFCILQKTFEVGVEMTASLKVKRNVVNKMYKREIDKLFE